jgi:hypothetical protein
MQHHMLRDDAKVNPLGRTMGSMLELGPGSERWPAGDQLRPGLAAGAITAMLFATALGAAISGMVANVAGLTAPGVDGVSNAALWLFAIFLRLGSGCLLGDGLTGFPQGPEPGIEP